MIHGDLNGVVAVFDGAVLEAVPLGAQDHCQFFGLPQLGRIDGVGVVPGPWLPS